jgi:MFS family permease
MGIFLGTGVAYGVGGTVVDIVMRMKAVTLPLLGTIAAWRLSFLLVGLPGLLFVLWIYTIKEPLRRNLLRAADGKAPKLLVSEVLAEARLRWQSLLGVSFAMIFQSMTCFAFFAWGPTFFQRMHGWSAGYTGRILGVIVIVFGCAGMFIGGSLSDYWQHRGVYEGPLKVGVIGAVGSAVLFPLAMLNSSAAVSLLLIAPGFLFFGLPIGCAYASVQLIFPNQVRGQVSAFLMFILNLGGLSLGPYLPGLFNDVLFKNEKMIGASVALTIAGAAILQFIIFRITYRYYHRDYARMHPAEASH